MAYLLDQVNMIAGKRLILLLDHYALLEKNKNYFQILEINSDAGLYVSTDTLTSIKNKNSTIPCYGIWQLLYQSRQIDFEETKQLLVIYDDEQNKRGLFLYYCHQDKDYRSGLVVGDQFMGLFGIDLPAPSEVQVDEHQLVKYLDDEVLRPIDRYKKEQSLFRLALIYGVMTIGTVAGVLFLFLSILLPSLSGLFFNNTTNLPQEVQALQQQLKRSKLELNRLQASDVSVHIVKNKLPLLVPLSVLSSLGVNFNLTADLADESGQLVFDRLYPWMSQLPTDVFQILEQDEKIVITWGQS